MRERYQEELRVAQDRGVVSPEEAESLLSEGQRVGRPPLVLLVERGVISEETLAEIQAAARNGAPPHGDGPIPHGSPTLTLQPAPSQPVPSPQEPAFPVPGWERYQPVRFLGQGGMGRVYLAYDPLLRRNVALKFVRGDDPELMRRFVAEAQAQARVEHERVCKVYEVGEVKGQPFIAMQYVMGRTLLEVARELSLEQMVTVVQQATEGVHAAHRAGLIHRDIKPTNILVERGEDGQWRPYVMDFGLAREWQRETTVTGTVLGTPHYMAPEQARGEVSQLDRRADVYSLGATLYVLLTGKPPIPGSNALEVLSNLATQEPRPPRQLNKDVPADLEAIVLKCLEREPSARYGSARALAEDLERFLNGEPVQARTVGAWYRLRKKARKHWALVSMASAALVLVSLALGQVVLTRREMSIRASLTRRFTELAGDVGARARFMALSRLHDTSAERQALRERLKHIEQEMQQSGEVALGVGNYALGQGWLELGDPAKAREHLEVAWRYGYQEPRVASALALALGQLYHEHLRHEEIAREQLQDSLSSEQLQARRRELVRLYRAPALSWLRLSQDAFVLPKEYIEALLHFYEERYDDALANLDTLGERMPWFYEAPKLRGDILHMRAMVRWDDGKRTEEERATAQAHLEAARQAYARAADTAQSLPETHYGLARVEWAALVMDRYDPARVSPHVERALEHLSRALQVSPDHTASWVLQATLYRNLAASSQGSQAEESLRKAIKAAKKAVALAPSHLEARKELGMDLWQMASLQDNRGQDPREHLRQAFETFEGVEPAKKDYYIHHGLGLVFGAWADYEERIGADPLPHRGKAIEAYHQTLQLHEQYQAAWNNLAYQYLMRAAHPRARAVEEDLDQARQALERSRALNSRSVVAHFNEGKLQLIRAQRLRDTGVDERPALAAAIDSCQKGLTLNPRLERFHLMMGRAHMEQARGAWDRGEDPLPLLNQAQQSLERARALAPEQASAYNILADLHSMRAVYLHSLAEDPLPSTRAALQSSREAQRRTPEHPFPLIDLGHASQLLAEFTLKAQGDPSAYLAEATEMLHQALQRAPAHAGARLYLAETRALHARWQAQQGRGADKDFEEAAQTYHQALKSAGRPLDYRMAFIRFCREWATWRQQAGLDPHPPLELGLALAGEVLTARPSWAEARALRASLQALLFKSLPDAAPQLSQALQELREALRSNPNLKSMQTELSHPAR